MAREPRTAVAALPGGPGVYRFRDARGRVLYIGRAVDLRRRVGSYWADLRDRRHLIRMVPQIVQVEAVACDSAHEAAWLERNLLERSKPRWNRLRGGLEVPAYILLDRGPAAARLHVVHSPLVPAPRRPGYAVRVFGPYLGGTRARLAVSALDRALPLAYADDTLSGCHRDLARARGIDSPDRDGLLARVTAVLERRPAAVEAVQEQLARLRDRASANLAFELAARVQQELEAIAWIASEQKVTLLPATGSRPADDLAVTDCDVHGWADGLLIRFEVRGGRMCTWQVRDCAQATAQRHLDDTPVRWRAFAHRNAELSKRLADGDGGTG